MELLFLLGGIVLGICIGSFGVVYELSSMSIVELVRFRNEMKREMEEFYE